MYPVTIVGNVGNEPEMRFTKEGKPVVDLSIAVNKDQDLEGKEITVWMRSTFWNEQAELVNKSINKGSKVQVSGFLKKMRMWDDEKTGEKRTNYEMTGIEIKTADYTFKDIVAEPVEEAKGKEKK